MKSYNIPVFVPHLGCPHDCVFCNQKKITGKSSSMTPEAATETIKSWLNVLPRDSYKEIAFFGGSFTAIDMELQNDLLSAAKKFVDGNMADGIRLSTRPDCINKEILDNLLRYGVTSVELGVQSMCDDVLVRSERGHTSYDTLRAVNLIKEYPFHLGLQMMTGLPGDTYERSIDTAKKIASLAPDFVRIYPTLVIKDTKLESMMKNGEYVPMSLEETVELVADIKTIFDEKNIEVIRIGMQTTDEISPKATVSGGPFHSAIGELVESRLYLRRLMHDLAKHYNSVVRVECSKQNVSKIIGHSACNRDFLKEHCGIVMIVSPNDEIVDNSYKITEVKKICF